jgi:hypothetical protein
MIEELGHELAAVGIRGRRRDRILAEVADHLACDPAADLGDAESLARQFANELAASGTRRAAFASLGALTLAAAALLGTQAAVATDPDIASGRSLALAAIATFCLFVCSQVAFVSGSLSAVRALRLRREREIPSAGSRFCGAGPMWRSHPARRQLRGSLCTRSTSGMSCRCGGPY